uniref:Uncharacterized protein n=1 Tax=viral metagenome TaxID=1070528 RepID=A0A6C0CMC0_9ZZZZ
MNYNIPIIQELNTERIQYERFEREAFTRKLGDIIPEIVDRIRYANKCGKRKVSICFARSQYYRGYNMDYYNDICSIFKEYDIKDKYEYVHIPIFHREIIISW